MIQINDQHTQILAITDKVNVSEMTNSIGQGRANYKLCTHHESAVITHNLYLILGLCVCVCVTVCKSRMK